MLPRPPDPRSLSCLFCEISTAPVGGGGALQDSMKKEWGCSGGQRDKVHLPRQKMGLFLSLEAGIPVTCKPPSGARSKAATLSSIAPVAKAKRTHQTREGCGECQSASVASLLKSFPRFPHLPLEVQPLPTATTPRLWGLVLPSPAHPQCRQSHHQPPSPARDALSPAHHRTGSFLTPGSW